MMLVMVRQIFQASLKRVKGLGAISPAESRRMKTLVFSLLAARSTIRFQVLQASFRHYCGVFGSAARHFPESSISTGLPSLLASTIDAVGEARRGHSRASASDNLAFKHQRNLSFDTSVVCRHTVFGVPGANRRLVEPSFQPRG
jgi:hypothetical protein